MEKLEAMFRNTAMVAAASNGVKPNDVRKEWPLRSDTLRPGRERVVADDEMKRKILTANGVKPEDFAKYGL
jgi:hypothetical protein